MNQTPRPQQAEFVELNQLPQLKHTLTLTHTLLILCAVGIWGTNFVIMKNTVLVLPPLLLAAMRFFFTLIPAIFFVPRPNVRWTNLMGYGLSIGVVQFGCLYVAVNGQITPGLASLVVQTQVIFTIGMSVYLNSERLRIYQLFALVLAVIGLMIIGFHADTQTTLGGLALTILAALGWATGNLFSKRAVGVNMISYIVWSTVFSVPALLGLSLYVEGAQSIGLHLDELSLQTWFAVLWQAWANTIFGYGIWGWLLARYTAATVTPFALLVPVFGMGASSIFLNESLPAWKLGAAGLVIAAMLLNTFGARLVSVIEDIREKAKAKVKIKTTAKLKTKNSITQSNQQ